MVCCIMCVVCIIVCAVMWYVVMCGVCVGGSPTSPSADATGLSHCVLLGILISQE